MKPLAHIVRFEAGYDCIRFECRYGSAGCRPGSGGSHGRHGLNILFVAKGSDGAVQFVLYTGWLPQFTKPDSIGLRSCEWGGGHTVVHADLGYYSKAPRHAGQASLTGDCEFCDGQPCYYDGLSLNANDGMYALVNGGDAALWAFLDGYYAATFEGAPYPIPAENATPPRTHGKDS